MNVKMVCTENKRYWVRFLVQKIPWNIKISSYSHLILIFILIFCFSSPSCYFLFLWFLFLLFIFLLLVLVLVPVLLLLLLLLLLKLYYQVRVPGFSGLLSKEYKVPYSRGSVFTVCSQKFILLWLRKTTLIVETYQLRFCMFICAFHPSFGKFPLFFSYFCYN